MSQLLRVEDLRKVFPVTRGSVFRRSVGQVRAVDGVSLSVAKGETLGLVGESGCGKSTLARCLLRLVEPTSGRIDFEGRDVLRAGERELRDVRRRMQIVFQDPYGSLDPRMSVYELVAEPLFVHKMVAGRREARDRVSELLELVKLSPEHGERYPHEFSGGQRQRIGIARALASGPSLVVLDEPVSALDVSIRAQILNLLADLQARLGVSYLFISHDLSTVRQLSHRVAVMYLGTVVEVASCDELFEAPRHPYTQALLSAIPLPDPVKERRRRRLPLSGEVLGSPDGGQRCRFSPRCFKVQDICRSQEPPLELVAADGHLCACFFEEPRKVV